MADDAGKRFVRGLISSGRGVTQAWVDALIEEKERKEAEKAERRQAQVDALRERNIESIIREREAPAERKGFALTPGQARFEFDEETGEFREVAKLPPKEAAEKPGRIFGGDPEGVFRETAKGIEQIVALPEKKKKTITAKQKLDLFKYYERLSKQEIDPQTFHPNPLLGINPDSAVTATLQRLGIEDPDEKQEFKTAKDVEDWVKDHPEDKELLNTPWYKAKKKKK